MEELNSVVPTICHIQIEIDLNEDSTRLIEHFVRVSGASNTSNNSQYASIAIEGPTDDLISLSEAAVDSIHDVDEETGA